MNKEFEYKIEEINKEFIDLKNSKEYLNGRLISTILEDIKHFKILKLLSKIIKFLQFKLVKTIVAQDKPKFVNIISNSKIVIYTCIVGKYDKLADPLFIDKNIEYILFTNNKSIKSKVWKTVNISDDILKNYNSNILINRYIKMHPHELLKGYDFSIYIDGNVRIISDIQSFINTVPKKSGLSFHRHPDRNCIYNESKVCLIMNKGNKYKLKEQLKQYRTEKFPNNYGILEGNVIVANLKNNYSKEILEDWWKEFLKSGSLRDQISLPYILWRKKIGMNDIGNLGNGTKNNTKLQLLAHKDSGLVK